MKDTGNVSSLVRIGYYFAPQDRRKIRELPTQYHVRLFWERELGNNILNVLKATDSSLVMTFFNVTVGQMEELAVKINSVIDLCDDSFYNIVDVSDEIGKPEDVSLSEEERNDAASKFRRAIHGMSEGLRTKDQ